MVNNATLKTFYEPTYLPVREGSPPDNTFTLGQGRTRFTRGIILQAQVIQILDRTQGPGGPRKAAKNPRFIRQGSSVVLPALLALSLEGTPW